MMIPGGNLLGLAMTVIAPQILQYRPFLSRTKNDEGILASKFAAPAKLRGSIQPVPRQKYEQMGLEFQKNYVTIFIEKNAIDMSRDVAGDEFWYSGRLYQAESRTTWFAQDGWESILCVEVPGYTPPFPPQENAECCSA